MSEEGGVESVRMLGREFFSLDTPYQPFSDRHIYGSPSSQAVHAIDSVNNAHVGCSTI